MTGEYPTPTGEQLYQLALKSTPCTGDESTGGDGRTYEVCPPNGNGVNGHLPKRDQLVAALASNSDDDSES